MPIEITMPRLSDTMEQGTLVKWRIKLGDQVKSGDVLADVETDKATMELQAFDDGTVAKLALNEGESTKVGQLILVLAGKGESVEQAAQSAGTAANTKSATAPMAAAGDDKKNASSPASADGMGSVAGSDGSRVRISPLAKRLAEEHGLDVARIRGSGPDGRIIKNDVLAAIEGKAQPSAPALTTAPLAANPVITPSKPITAATPANSTSAATSPATSGASIGPALKLEAKTVPLTGMRRTIAKRLVESKTTIPHFTVTISVLADPLLELRVTMNKQLESQGIRLSVNDFIVRATALALVQHPECNASFAGDAIVMHGTVNLGIAVALPAEKGGGLVVPVLRDVQLMGLRAISHETKAYVDKARTKGLAPQDMADGTFTLSNLGMFGIDHFEAIINPPQAAILAVGAAIERPVVKAGQLVPGHEMQLTLSADHRVIDGAIAAAYLATLKKMLENPATLLV